jgi:16S rRNA (cytosine1402-N4)-methyltransferase
MLNEVVHYLNCRPGKIYVDCTLGGAGHSKAICEKILPAGLLIGIDQDLDAIDNAQQVLQDYTPNIRLFHGNFIYLSDYLKQLEIDYVDGIVADLGVSQHQIENSGRGFSFNKDEPLDMRMNVESPETAEKLVNQSSEKELRRIFKEYGEERWAKQIARNIARHRKADRIRTSRQLVQIVRAAIPSKAASKQRIHPATRVFMALRIAVNRELERLLAFMQAAADFLNPGGRICVLAFHSLEDRIVKQQMKALSKGCTCPPDFPKCVCNKQPRLRLLTKKVIRPTAEEIAINPMARSTRLRAAEKI